MKEIDYLVVSDVHLGARNTSYREIINHLDLFFHHFADSSPYSKLDALFIAGDLWDDTIELSSEVLVTFVPFWHRLLRWCHRNNIILRVLEGTPRHDRGQGKTLSEITAALLPELDFQYVSALSIEKNATLGLSILYVPDECRHTAEVVYQDVLGLMAEAQLTSVDIAIMHGMFQYQLGTIPMNSKVYDEQRWLALVNHYLSIGHIHVHSQYERIVAQGSFDRLSHGEEGAKGVTWFHRDSTGEWSWRFIENKAAKIYRTLKVSGDVDKALKQIDKEVKLLPDESHVRIQAVVGHPVFQGFETLRKKYPFITFTKKAIEEAATSPEQISTKPTRFAQIPLNRETLTEAILVEIKAAGSLEIEDEGLLRKLLEELHD